MKAMRKLIGNKYKSYSQAQAAAWEWLFNNRRCGFANTKKMRIYRYHAAMAVKDKPYWVYIFRTGTDDYSAYYFSTLTEAQEYAAKLDKKRRAAEEKRWKKDIAGPIPKEYLEKWNRLEADKH